ELEAIKRLNASCVLIHGSISDRRLYELKDAFKIIEKHNPRTIVGVATHSPGSTIDKFMLMEEIRIILSPINARGEFMEPSAEKTLLSIKKARENGIKVIGMKTLAAGKIHPREAFEYVCDKVDGVALGVASSKELYETLSLAGNYF
ncbi:MAG: hypothetical protein QW265_02860, partial [Candidatus Bathyarchaeia archaeon]